MEKAKVCPLWGTGRLRNLITETENTELATLSKGLNLKNRARWCKNVRPEVRI